MALNSLELQDGKRAAELLERCVKDFPASARTADVLLGLARAYTLDDQPDKAAKWLRAVIERHPASPAATEARRLLESR